MHGSNHVIISLGLPSLRLRAADSGSSMNQLDTQFIPIIHFHGPFMAVLVNQQPNLATELGPFTL